MNRREQKELARTGKPVIKLHFLGAAGGVTGSLNLVEVFSREKVTRFILDVGLHVDDEKADHQNRLPKGMTMKDINFVIISHAHLDHSGLLPKMMKDGFKGPAYCTTATRDLMEILLPDSGHIQEEKVERLNRRNERKAAEAVLALTGSASSAKPKGSGGRSGKQTAKNGKRNGVKGGGGQSATLAVPVARKPLYTEEEARQSMKLVRMIDYGVRTKLADDIFVTLTDAGHLLGSAVVMMEMGSGSQKRSLCFTGNVGRGKMPVLKSLEAIRGADYVITESTYGNRLHVVRDRHARLADIINRAYERAKAGSKANGSGVILIPAFAVGRAQIVLDDLRQLIAAGAIPNLKVYLDGRMSIKATEVHRKHAELLNKETAAVIAAGGDPFATPRFELAQEWPDSARLQEPQSEPILVVGSSGMANGGRIVAHLAKRLSYAENTVVFVGYQGTGTLGNALVRFADGNPFVERTGKAESDGSAPKTVNVQGKPTRVRATVEFMSDYSGHADYMDIVNWLGKFTHKPKMTFMVHGDEDALEAMRQHVATRLRWNATVPKGREVFELS